MKNQKGVSNLLTVGIVVVAGILVAGLVLGWNYYQKTSGEEKGFIEGSLSYPSEFIPLLRICAENVENGRLYCTENNIENNKYRFGKGYMIEVPAGNYYVFATGGLAGLKDVKAYYTKIVACEMQNNCWYQNECGTKCEGVSRTEPMTINVEAGKNLENINPVF